MKETVNFSQFCDAFGEERKNQFSYKGKRALFDYLEEYENDTGTEIELDVIALCCEYSEYDSAVDCIHDCGYNFTPDLEGVDPQELDAVKEEQSREWLGEQTQVIDVDGGGVIIQQF